MDSPVQDGLRIELGSEPMLALPDGTRVALPPRDALLLARLLLDGPQPRAALAAWLWSQAPAAGALANLRQRLKRLQDASDGALLQLDGAQVALAGGVAHAVFPSPGAGLPVAPGQPLLPAIDTRPGEPGDAPARAWLRSARQRVRLRCREACAERARALEDAGAVDEALPLARWLVDDDPDDAAALRMLMRLHHARGEAALALRAFHAHRQHLHEQLATPPDAATQALADTLAATVAVPAPAPPAVPQGEASAAWLPPEHPLWALLSRPPQRVQRDAAWAQLQALARDGGVAWLLGPGGVGKTRLAHDFCEAHAVPLRLACRPGWQAVPYALLAAWVRGHLPAAQGLPAAERAELARLEPSLGDAASGPLQPARLLRALQALPLPLPHAEVPSAPPAPMAPMAQVTVCIDDLHLADAASLELLPALLAGLPGALLCLRPDEAPPRLREWLAAAAGDARTAHRIELGAFDADGVAALLADLALPGMATADWVPLLLGHTGGHPYLLLETLRTLARGPRPAGDIPPERLPIPPRVRELLLLRLQALSPLARQLAELAALAGEHFSARLATVALGGVAQQAGQAWAELQGSGFLGAAAFGQARLHDLVAEALRGAMPPPVAAQRNRQVATALKALGPVPAARLAHHWAEAGEPRRAARLHERAAQEAERLSRVHEQVAELDRAAVQWTLAHEAARAFQARARAAEVRITHQQVQEGLAQAHALLDIAADVAQQTMAQRLLAIAHAYLYQHESALRWATQAHAGARSLGQLGQQVDAAGIAAVSAAQLGQAAQAQDWLAHLQAVPPEALDGRTDINRHTSASNALVTLGQAQAGLKALEQALALSLTPALQAERAAMLSNAASLSVRLGLAEDTLRHAREALALAQPLAPNDGSATWINARVHVGLGQILLGRLDDARQSLQEARERCADAALVYWRAMIDNHLIGLWIQLGQPARALRLLQEPDTALSPEQRMRRWALRSDLRRLCGGHAVLPPAPPATPGDLPTLALFELALAQQRPAAARMAELQALHARLLAKGLEGGATWIGLHALEAQAEAAPTGPGAGPAAGSADAVLALWQQVRQRCCLAAYRPELLQRLAALLDNSGLAAEAAAARAEARAWVQQAEQRLRGTVWHEAFVHRNLVNAALLRGG